MAFPEQTTASVDVPPIATRERLLAWAMAFLLLPLASFAIAGSYYFDRPFWSDEVLSWLIASDPSFNHGMAALAGGVDTNAPLLHLLFRVVGEMFGAAPLVYRATCAAAMSLALVGLYLSLRRHVRTGPAVLGVLSFAALPIVIAHTTEARFYSMQLAAYIWTHLWLAQRRGRATPVSAIAVAIASAALCGVHYFGVIALTCLIIAELAARHDRMGRFRGWLNAVYPTAAGFVTTACLLPLIVAQRAAMHDAGGTWVPDEFIMNLRTTMVSLLPAPAVVALIAAAAIACRAIGSRRVIAAFRAHRVLLLTGAAYLMTMFAFDRLVQPVFVPRYFIVALPAFAAIVAAIASHASARVVRIAGLCVTLGLAGQWWQIRVRSQSPSGRSAAGLIASVRTSDEKTPIVSDWLGHALPIWTSLPERRGDVQYLADRRLHEAGFDQAIRYERQMAICVERFYGMPVATSLTRIEALARFILLTEFPETAPERFAGWSIRPLGDVTLEMTRVDSGRATAAE